MVPGSQPSKDHVWSYDFVMDLTDDGCPLKMMPIVDDYTRECLTVKVERSITAEDVVGGLEALFTERGNLPSSARTTEPRIHCQGRKVLAFALRSRTALHIEPGSPWENAYSETFISRLEGVNC